MMSEVCVLGVGCWVLGSSLCLAHSRTFHECNLGQKWCGSLTMLLFRGFGVSRPITLFVCSIDIPQWRKNPNFHRTFPRCRRMNIFPLPWLAAATIYLYTFRWKWTSNLHGVSEWCPLDPNPSTLSLALKLISVSARCICCYINCVSAIKFLKIAYKFLIHHKYCGRPPHLWLIDISWAGTTTMIEGYIDGYRKCISVGVGLWVCDRQFCCLNISFLLSHHHSNILLSLPSG